MNSEWISVEERLPEYMENVIVFFSGINRAEGSVLPRIDTSCRTYHLGFLLENIYGPVTHWMPLPEPPEVKA